MLVSLGQAICDVISETGSRGLGLENRSGAVNEQLGNMSQPGQGSGATAALQPPVSAPSQPPVSAASQPLTSSAALPVGQPAALLPPVLAHSVGSSSSASLEIVRTLCSQLALSRLPTPQPSVFSGDPLKYSSWKRSFETLISSKAIPKRKGFIISIVTWLGTPSPVLRVCCLLAPPRPSMMPSSWSTFALVMSLLWE